MIVTPELSGEKEGGGPPLASLTARRGLPPSVSLKERERLSIPAPSNMGEGLSRKRRREGTLEREYGHPWLLENLSRG